MANAEVKTKATDASVKKFLDSVDDESKRADVYKILALMEKATGEKPKMWGSSIVGFGDFHYISPQTGREGEWFLTGFSPRKQNLTLYATGGGWDRYPELLGDLGKHSLGMGCLYIKRLSDVDMPTLKKLVNQSIKDGKKARKEQAALADAKHKKKAGASKKK